MEQPKTNNSDLIICNWCNQHSHIVWVHGHGQCSVCGYNVDECCRGELSNLPNVIINPGKLPVKNRISVNGE